MEEAERLCDCVAIIERGRLIEVGTPNAPVRKHCPERAVVFTSDGINLAELTAGLMQFMYRRCYPDPRDAV